MDRIFAQVAKGAPPSKGLDEGQTQGAPQQQQQQQDAASAANGQALPKGVVIGPDGKPCRSCTSTSDWAAMFKAKMKGPGAGTATVGATSPSAAAGDDDNFPVLPADCPPDVDRLGQHTWTLLHSISANYPERASSAQQADMRSFLALFSKLYPCWVCAGDFRDWMARPGNAPRVDGREDLGTWMCEAHNEVNRKLGKAEFDCKKWRERWRDGWKDGRCDF